MAYIPSHYPHAVRSLLELFHEGALDNVTGVVVEPDYGYIAQINYANGTHRIIHGSDLGLNTSSANELADDKGHTKFMLRNLGINCPNGREFILPWWAEVISGSARMRNFQSMHTTEESADYIHNELGFPVFIKPVNSSKGANIYKIDRNDELEAVLQTYANERVSVAVIEEPVDMPDYRLVILDGQLISAYKRLPLKVTGDGQSTIAALLAERRVSLANTGRDIRINPADPRILPLLKKKGLDLQAIPPADSEVVLADVSNLSAGGTSEDVTAVVHDEWKDLAANIASNFNLRLCGIDLMCDDITSPSARYSVLEVNASPGLDHFAASGPAQQQIVRDMYIKVFNAPPA